MICGGSRPPLTYSEKNITLSERARVIFAGNNMLVRKNDMCCLMFADGGGMRQQSAAWGGGELQISHSDIELLPRNRADKRKTNRLCKNTYGRSYIC